MAFLEKNQALILLSFKNLSAHWHGMSAHQFRFNIFILILLNHSVISHNSTHIIKIENINIIVNGNEGFFF